MIRKLFSALAHAVLAMKTAVTTVWSYCAETGKWIGKTVASIGATGTTAQPQVIEETAEDLAEYASASDIIPHDNGADVDALIERSKAILDAVGAGGILEDNNDRIKAICGDIAAGRDYDMLEALKLSWTQARWLDTMPIEMHAIVGNASRAEIVEHMRGKKSIRGVLPCNRTAIDAYRSAVELDNPSIDWDEPTWLREPQAAGMTMH